MPQYPLWHPFANMSEVSQNRLTLVRGEGCVVYDDTGRSFVDALAGLWFCNVGYGRAHLVDVAAQQMSQLPAFHIFGDLTNKPAGDLAQRLVDLSPIDDAVAFFTSGGSEAVDTAAKIARRFWQATGEPERKIIIARSGAYHGMAAYGTSLAGIPVNAHGYGPLITDVIVVPADDADALETAFIENRGRVAAFIGEPIRGSAGVFPPLPGYWKAVEQLCREDGALLIVDEVITGFGRTGHWFASQHYDIEPDLLICAKGMTSGYMPMGAVLAAPRVYRPFFGEDAPMLRHGYTYSGHPVAAAVALANLDIIANEGLLDQAAEMATLLGVRLGKIGSHPLVGEVRHAGLLAGVELKADVLDSRPGIGDETVRRLRDAGILTRLLIGRTLQISPALIIESDQIDMMVGTIEDVFDSFDL